MSYEGYEQILCTNGHYYETDAFLFTNEGSPCPYCQAKMAWWNPVDTTNDDGSADKVTLQIKEMAEYQRCDLDHLHCVQQQTYHIPEDKGYRTLDGGLGNGTTE